VVYSVEVQTDRGHEDVKVDAGDGRVLARDGGQDHAHEREGEHEGPEADGGNVQLEQ